jgi:2-isopropylmalate synthase
MDISVDGEIKSTTSSGHGPVDAIFNAVKTLVPHDAKLELYQVHAVTAGTDAQAEVTVRLNKNGNIVSGNSRDTDTLVASAKAYIVAVNKLKNFEVRKKDHGI